MPKVRKCVLSISVCVCVYVCGRERQCTWLLPAVQEPCRNSSTDSLLCVGAADAAGMQRVISSWLRVTELSFPTLAFCCRGTVEYLCAGPVSVAPIDFPLFPAASPFPQINVPELLFYHQKCQVVTNGAWRTEDVSENLSRLGCARWGEPGGVGRWQERRQRSWNQTASCHILSHSTVRASIGSVEQDTITVQLSTHSVFLSTIFSTLNAILWTCLLMTFMLLFCIMHYSGIYVQCKCSRPGLLV